MKLLAILSAKIVGWILHFKHGGGSFPGKLANQLYPDILSQLKVRGEVILVSGTNGKTSTANMLTQSLLVAKKNVVSNTKGDNMKNGILSALLTHANRKGIVDCDIAVLEVDELSMPYVMQHLSIQNIIITNFFRDQLDRAKEMEQLIKTVEASLNHFQGNLILNANDPNTVRFAYHLPHISSYFYGVESQPTTQKEEAREGVFCPICLHHLSYDHYQYSHIGTYHCPHCGFATPSTTLLARDVQGNEFHVGSDIYQAPSDALYMLYNCMAVLCLFDVLQLDKQVAKQAFHNYIAPMGRSESFDDHGRQITLHLVKNPTGTNEVLKQIEKDKQSHVILFVLNDEDQDGRDISWIYDVDFERMFTASLIITSGSRCYEAGLRMKYGGYPLDDIKVIEDMKQALEAARESSYPIEVLVTYTALASMHARLGGIQS